MRLLDHVNLIIILGLIFGSFANVVIYRLPRGESVVFPASRCPSCGHPLSAGDLVPVLGYIFLRGRCRYCGVSISPRYPLVEALMALLFLLVYLEYGLSITTLSGMVFSLVLVCSALIDHDLGIIPDALTIPALLVGLLLAAFSGSLFSALAGGLALGGLFLALAVLSNGGLGGGDIKLAAVIGVFCAWPGALTALVLISIIGGVYALYLLLAKGAHRKTVIRFGPILALGAFLAFNYGYKWAGWYLSLFNR